MNRLLVVEDSSEAYALIERALASEYELRNARTVAEASRLLATSTFDLILLDVMLPDGDGFKLCSLMRANDSFNGVPIIFLTSKNTISDQILGFSIGCDDFIRKPFHGDELKARIAAKLRRRQQEKNRAQVIRVGELELNKDTQKATVLDNGYANEIDLTPLEFKLLLFLAKEPQKVVSRDSILNTIWGENIHVYSRSVDTHISKLRKKLGAKSDYIVSVHGLGYKFCAPDPEPPLRHLEHTQVVPGLS